MPTDTNKTSSDAIRQISRRRALTKLGLAATIVYSAPVILPLNDEAMANGHKPPGPSGPKGAPKGWDKPSKPGKPPKVSKPKSGSKTSKPKSD